MSFLKNVLGAEKLQGLPTLVQSTPICDYIDNINPEEMTHPIMQGVDMYDRKFYAVKVHINNKSSGEITEGVGTFFERHSTKQNEWAYGSCYYDQGIIHHYSRVEPGHEANLERRLKVLIDGGSVCNIEAWSATGDELVYGNGNLEVTLAA